MKILHSYPLMLGMFLLFSLSVFAKTGDTVNYVNILKKSPAYNTSEKQIFPAFTYQLPSDPNLTHLRLTYHLDSVAGSGSDISKAIRLLEWFHNQVPHEDVGNLPVLNAENIIKSYKEKHISQGCYPLSIAANEIFLSMGFKSRSVICFSGTYPHSNGGHVINSVFIPSLDKWIYMDPQDNAYVKDERGNFLSIAEVRERLISGEHMVLNKTANYHHVPDKIEDYLYKFIAMVIYRMISPVNSEYDSQTRSNGKILRYVELLPAGSTDPVVDNFETSIGKNSCVITYHTNNDQLFWQKP